MKLFNFFKNYNKPKEVIQEFNSDQENLISYEQLKTFEIGKKEQVIQEREGAIEVTRINSSEKSLSFRVEMQEGEYWKIHKHDCEETILLYKGKLKDRLTKTEINRIQPIVIEPYTPHIIEAKEYSIFYVEFKAPQK